MSKNSETDSISYSDLFAGGDLAEEGGRVKLGRLELRKALLEGIDNTRRRDGTAVVRPVDLGRLGEGLLLALQVLNLDFLGSPLRRSVVPLFFAHCFVVPPCEEH